MNDIYFGQFEIVAERDHCHEIAQRYVDETEAYDRKICHIANKWGTAQPVTMHEIAQCNRYAQIAWGRAQDSARGVGATADDLRRAMRNVRTSLPLLPEGPIHHEF